MIIPKSLFLNRKASFFYKLILSVIIVAVIPLFFGTLVYYKFSTQSLEKKIHSINEAYLEQMSNSLDIVLSNVLDVSKLLLVDPVFKSYSAFPQKEYFSSYKDRASSFTDEERKNLITYLDMRNKISEKIELIPILNEFIDSVYYYNSDEKTVFKSGELPQVLTDYREIQWFNDVLNETNTFPYIMNTRLVRNHRHGSKRILTIVYKNILDNIPFLLNIDIESLYDNIVDEKKSNENTSFFVLSGDENLILFDIEKEQYINDLIKIIPEQQNIEKISHPVKINGDKYYINKVELGRMNWSFYSFINTDLYRGELYLLRFLVFILAFSILSLIFILGYFYSRYLYRPVENLVSTIKRTSDISDLDEQGDLFYIKNYVESAIKKNNVLKKQLSDAMPSYKKDFLSDLLKPNDYSIKEIRERVELLDINLELENVLSLIILIDDYTYQQLTFKEQLVFRISLAKIVEESLQSKFAGEMIEMESHKFVCIINCRSGDSQSVHAMAELLIENIHLTLKCESTVALGSYGRSIYDLSKSYNEAEELLKYQLLFGKGTVIDKNNINLTYDSSDTFDISESIQLLINNIQTGKFKEAGKRISQLLSELYLPGNRFSDKRIQQAGLDILNKILAALDDLELDQFILFSDSKTLYIELHHLGGKEEIESFFLDMLKTIEKNSISHTKNRKNRNIEIIYEILESDFGENMNLNNLADRLQLNPSYISRTFKESTGISFIDYLTNLRIEKSKELLDSTELNIQDICLKVGYWNTNYFIKVFKKKTGKTPGEYRRDCNLSYKLHQMK